MVLKRVSKKRMMKLPSLYDGAIKLLFVCVSLVSSLSYLHNHGLGLAIAVGVGCVGAGSGAASFWLRIKRIWPLAMAAAAAQEPRTPRWAGFLLLLIPPRDRDGIIGDLEEEFTTVLVPQYGTRLARFYYWWHALLAVSFFALATVEKFSKALRRN